MGETADGKGKRGIEQRLMLQANIIASTFMCFLIHFSIRQMVTMTRHTFVIHGIN
jgi:hypothetical protein